MYLGAAGSYGESRHGRFETYHPKHLVLQQHHDLDISDGHSEQGTCLLLLFHTGHIQASPGFHQSSPRSNLLTRSQPSSSGQGVGLKSTKLS
ncbi:hypothetical protein ASPFODRAFT_592629 [Aspergillus luchuensis CBS 106.47]|uniref:Uncharacterized protein n=1 Tax=Aspergillus luchuensis (strain CBS 106.47) TaxID=1137211 RepID=A0A1M3SYJ8_ASPLC|nr:hypothetical protein ASPFODRAFT_592629 [Aspergillus luchuensis CBS 106.47]